MAEQPGGFFAELPVPVSRPQGGQFGSVETGSHTGDRVVPGDLVAAEEPQPSAGQQRGGITPRLACCKTVCAAGYQFHQPPQSRVRKMVQKQVGDDPVHPLLGGVLKPIEDIALFDDKWFVVFGR